MKRTVVRSVVLNEARIRPRDRQVDGLRRGIDRLNLLTSTIGLRCASAFEDSDGHPNPVGHRLIAETVSERKRAHR